MTPIQAAFRLLSSNRLTILIFHRVLPSLDPIFPDEPDAARFDEMMGWMKSWFNVLPLDAAVSSLKAGTLPQRAAAITFDDGYADNYTVALPILKKHNLSASFFIATGFLNGGWMWNDMVIESIRATPYHEIDLAFLQLGRQILDSPENRRQTIEKIIGKIKYLPVPERLAITEQLADLVGVTPPADLMMTSQQLIELHHAGMQIGAHTVSHPILAKLSESKAVDEIAGSRDFLTTLLKERIRLFAYPNGRPGTDYLPEQTRLVSLLGFDAAVSTTYGAAKSTSDLYQLPRFTPWDRTKLRFAARLAKNFAQ
ncbi:MAG: carbohydrate esterase family protein [Betaproteobacteria bacterium HGW-Betaproteobacteria-10]|nr:MAG: carbohydrate esterase family protein [Betaproteobacteria bacterium HGW-Betaproteobacteria-10]